MNQMTDQRTNNSIRILLVDDDVDFVDSMSGILELEGYPVVSAHTSSEAINRLESFNPDVALVDIRIGQENGLDLVEKLHKVMPDLTCVVVTAYSDTDTAVAALKRGVYDYLRKPFETAELFAVLHRCADRLRLLSDKKSADLAKEESDVRFRVAFDTSPDAIVLAYPGGEIIDVNAGFEKMTGYRKEKVVGLNSQEVGLWKNPDDRVLLLEQLGNTGAVNNIESEFRLSDGRIRRGLMSARVVQLAGEQVGIFVVRDIHDLRLKESAIQESEERFRGLVSNIPGAVYRCDLDKDWSMQYISSPIRDISGYDATDFVQNSVRSFASIIHPDDSENVTQAVAFAVSRKQPFTLEYRLLNADGSVRWVHEKGRAILNPDGSVRCLDGAIFDITESKMRENLLAIIAEGVSNTTGEDFFRALIARLSSALNADYAFVGEINPANQQEVTSLFAYANGEPAENFTYQLAGTPCETVTTQGVCTFPENVQGEFPEDQLLVDMGVNAYVGAPLVGSSGVPLGILVVLYRQPRKIPEHVERVMQIYASRAAAELGRLHSEKELQQSEERYRKLSQEYNVVLDGIPDIILHIDSDLKILWGNKGARQLAHGNHPELQGKDCSVLWGRSGERVAESVKWAIDSCSPVEIVIKTNDHRSWGAKFFPVKTYDETVKNVILIASDLTEKTRLREQAARSAHLAALGELAAGVAHEINNPTGMILLDVPMLKDAFNDLLPLLEQNCEILKDKKIGGLSFERFCQEAPLVIEEIQEGAERIKRIVEELKDFSRPSTGEQTVVDLNEVVKKAVSLVRNPLKNATDKFKENYSSVPLCFNGNAQRLEQVMVNLLINACHALPDKNKEIEVETSICEEKDCVRVVVRDEGVGIKQEMLSQIADPFFTTRRDTGGTGLGLSVSSRIIDEHMGSFVFDSEPGKGTVVTVELPIAAKAAFDD